MSSRLVNVRLDPERQRKVKALRASGIAISDLVREAIDEQYERLAKPTKPRDVNAMMERIFEQFPDPPDLPPRGYNVHNRREAAAAIREHLTRKKRRA